MNKLLILSLLLSVAVLSGCGQKPKVYDTNIQAGSCVYCQQTYYDSLDKICSGTGMVAIYEKTERNFSYDTYNGDRYAEWVELMVGPEWFDYDECVLYDGPCSIDDSYDSIVCISTGKLKRYDSLVD